MSNNIIKPQVRVPEVILPSDIIEQKYSGEIKGYFVENSNTYNILPIDQNANIDQNRIMQVGYILPYNPITTLFGIDDNIILTQFKFLKLKDVDQKDMLSVLTNSMAKPTDNSEIKHISIGDTKQIESDCINLLMQTKYNNDPQHQDLTWIENSMFIYNLCLSEDDFNSICKSNINNNLVGYWEDDSLHFLQLSTRMECKQQPYTLKLDVFSRNTGILESDIMMNKAAVFIGCGSVGSLFALELAKAGVSKFLLIDNDIFGYHNICRHQCGIYDVGRFKTDALRERILEINPYANVVTQNTTIQAMPVDELVAFCDNNTIVIGGADNYIGS